jgi:Holliday junction resolvasome RuvABC endonuclease subunit
MYLGLDQALANTGWCLVYFAADEKPVISYGLIKTSSKLDIYERLFIIETELKDLIKTHNVKQLFTECVFINHSRAGDSRSLVRVETIIHRLAHQEHIPYTIINSGKQNDSWKKVLGCHEKDDAFKLFYPLLNKDNNKYFDSKGEKIAASLILNCTDAIAITFTGLINSQKLNIQFLSSLLPDSIIHHLNSSIMADNKPDAKISRKSKSK